MSSTAHISGDGRYVVYDSDAENINGPNDDRSRELYLYDRVAQTTDRITWSHLGEEFNGTAESPRFNAAGRFVGYWAFASNVVPDDTNGHADAFIYDRTTGETRRITGVESGDPPTYWVNVWAIDMSADGRFFLFASGAPSLVENDTNDALDLFLYDLKTDEVVRVSLDPNGNQVSRSGHRAALSADSRYIVYTYTDVAFGNDRPEQWVVFDRFTDQRRVFRQTETTPFKIDMSDNGQYFSYVYGDLDETWQAYQYDRLADDEQLISQLPDGSPGLEDVVGSTISPDGRWLTLTSQEAFVNWDTNKKWDIYLLPSPFTVAPVAYTDVSVEITLSAVVAAETNSNHTYSITLENQGTGDASQVNASITLPDDVSVVQVDDDCSLVDGDIECPIGDLSPGSSEDVALTLAVAGTESPGLVLRADVWAAEVDTDTWNNTDIDDPDLPATPVLQTPDEEALVTDVPTLSWLTADNAEQYEVQLGTSNPPAATVTTTTELSFTPEAQLSLGIYYWRVRSVGANDQRSPWSATRRFVLYDPSAIDTGVPVLSSPGLTAPVDGYSTIEFPRLSWLEVAGAVQYEVQLDMSNPPTTVAATTTELSLLPNIDLIPGTYYWRVRTYNLDDVPSDWSAIRYFVVYASADDAAPTQNMHTVSTPTLSWNRVSWADGYQMQVATDTDFADVIMDVTTSSDQLSQRLPALPNDTYYWRARAQHGDGSWGDWSPVDSFVVNVYE